MLADAVLTQPDREEALSRAYVAAVVAGAGYTLSAQDFDRDGVDVQVRAGGNMRPSIDIQLKATVQLDQNKENVVKYPLRRHNYDLLREETMVPRILVVLDLPREESQWVSISAEELVLRRCAYWADIKDFPETDNKSSVTITIDRNNRFDIPNLKDLMERARMGPLS